MLLHLLFFVFFSPKPGLRGGDKSLLFSVAKRTTGDFSRIYRPSVRGRGKQRYGGGCQGGVGMGGLGCKAERRKEKAVKSRSSLNPINCNHLHRAGDDS